MKTILIGTLKAILIVVIFGTIYWAVQQYVAPAFTANWFYGTNWFRHTMTVVFKSAFFAAFVTSILCYPTGKNASCMKIVGIPLIFVTITLFAVAMFRNGLIEVRTQESNIFPSWIWWNHSNGTQVVDGGDSNEGGSTVVIKPSPTTDKSGGEWKETNKEGNATSYEYIPGRAISPTPWLYVGSVKLEHLSLTPPIVMEFRSEKGDITSIRIEREGAFLENGGELTPISDEEYKKVTHGAYKLRYRPVQGYTIKNLRVRLTTKQ